MSKGGREGHKSDPSLLLVIEVRKKGAKIQRGGRDGWGEEGVNQGRLSVHDVLREGKALTIDARSESTSKKARVTESKAQTYRPSEKRR